MRAKHRIDNVEPSIKKSKTDTEAPNREKLRRATAAPKLTYSNTDTEDAKRAMPNSAN